MDLFLKEKFQQNKVGFILHLGQFTLLKDEFSFLKERLLYKKHNKFVKDKKIFKFCFYYA